MITLRKSRRVRSAPRIESLETRLLMARVVADDYANTFTAAYNLALGSTGAAQVNGNIETSTDVDMFAFVAAGDGTAKVTMNAANKSTVNPALTIYDSTQTQVAYNNDTGTSKNSTISFTVTAGKKYYILADGYDTKTGKYTLALTSPVAPPPGPTPPSFLPAATAYAAASALSAQTLSTSGGLVLVVLGTINSDAATITQSADHLTLVTPAGSQDFFGTFSGIALYGFAGNDSLRLDASVTSSLPTVCYAGDGNDSLYANGASADYLYGDAGDDLVVSIGGKADYLYGGTGFDSFWADSTDTVVDADSTETAAKSIHSITAFKQPSTDPALAVSLEIAGQDIVDPTATYPYTNTFASKPLFADGPQYNDIRQGALGDCYLLASLSALSQTDPTYVLQSVTSLGDGTYAVRFFRGGTAEYYRVDAQLPTSGSNPAYAKLTRNGQELWVALLEKAFAQFRYSTNSYASIEGGWMDEGYTAITGGSYSSVGTSGDANALAQTIQNNLASGHAVTAASPATGVAPIVGSHAYEVRAVEYDTLTGVWYITVYNPWGTDGATWDSNSSDGLLRLTAAQFQSCYSYIEICNA